jgi:N-acetyl-anhydromuramyl-L-alanine amidase AmpD
MTNSPEYTDEDLTLSLRHNWEPELASEAQAEALEQQSGERSQTEAEEASGVALWYPQADRSVTMHVRGSYRDGYPVGAVVHFTAGRSERGDRDAEGTMRDGRANRYLYFCISSTGKVYQPAPLNQWGSHCGESSYPGLGSNLANKLAGIEICRAGLCKKLTDRGYEPWWNAEYPPGSPMRTYYREDEVRFVPKVHNVTDNGHYHKYTVEQEQSLHALLLWLHQNNPAVFNIKNILGHDEISPDRKNDPGGAMSEYMDQLRARITNLASTGPA